MVKNFTFCRLLCRFFGCFFIFDFNDANVDSAKATFKTAYTAYALAWLSVCLYFEGGEVIYRLELLDITHKFSNAVSTFLNVALTVKVLVNVGCMMFRSGQLLQFFRICAEYEKRSAFKRPTAREAWKRGWILRVIRLCILIAAISMASIMVIFSTTSSYLEPWAAAKLAARFLSITAYFFYDLLMYLVLRSVGEVLVWYISAQTEEFEECCKAVSSGTPVATLRCGQWASLKAESVRQNVCKIRELKCLINGIWNTAISISSVTLLWMECIALYAVFKNGVLRPDVCLSFCYATYTFLSFLELTCISQRLFDEAQKLKEAARRSSTLTATDSFFRQVEFLHYTIDPEGMRITGAGFFPLDKPLMVSIVGALITYTVIVVQTGDEITQRMRDEAATTTS
ncbi:hypothetical protein HPB49_021339 [Dermacentor silvarum]|uniref:Uncharacterized protein n=1 Tax=Dermacentor silvarum TaxID=543639 RepID=A0ACB8CBC3_DERSI|nr:hypothetical protein HPB49_021339 [Dermacentor silvarum]